jgi:hypothetical protein
MYVHTQVKLKCSRCEIVGLDDKREITDKFKKISRQCSILAVNFWSVTYFGVFNFGTSYLQAKIGQNKTMTKISRFTVSDRNVKVIKRTLGLEHVEFMVRSL